jgi:predicted Zn-dependent protease with MMP-like domain
MRRAEASPTSILQRVGAALVISLLATGWVSLIVEGFSSDPLLRAVQGLSLFGAGTGLLLGGISLVIVRLGGWREGDAAFDRLVERSEALARSDAGELDSDAAGAVEDGDERLELAGGDARFDALVREAIDELPLEFHRALEHVAIVISDSGASALGGVAGRRGGAYGMYQGDTVARDFFTERIFIFRDTLLRDFADDPEALRRQVRRVVRHELAHHLGWGERGVRNLGL